LLEITGIIAIVAIIREVSLYFFQCDLAHYPGEPQKFPWVVGFHVVKKRVNASTWLLPCPLYDYQAWCYWYYSAFDNHPRKRWEKIAMTTAERLRQERLQSHYPIINADLQNPFKTIRVNLRPITPITPSLTPLLYLTISYHLHML